MQCQCTEPPWLLRRFNGTRAVYTHTVKYDRDASCPVCSAGMALEVAAESTLAQLLELLHTRFPDLSAPSVSHGARPLYAHGVFEEETRGNLGRRVADVLREGGAKEPLQNVAVIVNDKRSPRPLRLRLTLA